MDFPGSAVVKNLPANVGDAKDSGSIPGSGGSPGGENCNTLQCSCLENSMERGAWWATVHGGHSESDTTEHHHSLMYPKVEQGKVKKCQSLSCDPMD